jgi:DNA-binding NarL/FixJ family response regulator
MNQQGRGWASDPVKAAGGRRRYHAQRRREATARRIKVMELMCETGLGRGFQATIAKELGVSEATVSRDMRVIFDDIRFRNCEFCGMTTRVLTIKSVVEIEKVSA